MIQKSFAFVAVLILTTMFAAYADQGQMVIKEKASVEVTTTSSLKDGKTTVDVTVVVKGSDVARVDIPSHPYDTTAPPSTILITSIQNHLCLWKLNLPERKFLGTIQVVGAEMHLRRRGPSQTWLGKDGHLWVVQKGPPPLLSSESVDVSGTLVWKDSSFSFQEKGDSKRTWARDRPPKSEKEK